MKKGRNIILKAALLSVMMIGGAQTVQAEQALQVDEKTEARSIVRHLSVQGTDVPASVSIPLNFEFDSAKLTEASRTILSTMVVALNDPSLQQVQFFVEGHTDATGSIQYNLRLSQQRANSVKDYLERSGVSGQRLTAVGYGETHLLPGLDPNSFRHRRVMIVRK